MSSSLEQRYEVTNEERTVLIPALVLLISSPMITLSFPAVGQSGSGVSTNHVGSSGHVSHQAKETPTITVADVLYYLLLERAESVSKQETLSKPADTTGSHTPQVETAVSPDAGKKTVVPESETTTEAQKTDNKLREEEFWANVIASLYAAGYGQQPTKTGTAAVKEQASAVEVKPVEPVTPAAPAASKDAADAEEPEEPEEPDVEEPDVPEKPENSFVLSRSSSSEETGL
ncbi:unnamed protein product [Cyprideis torosa]|uniref:Uncharacterized protein n=1 Tax=Cyprideis torosa TaxID=163714 RepID=A0A7R8W101_9CRUS|nr:unnamed protein product [Cyprideis torosa]CAG0880352.1 unnamed protein product [Cyprideis torosa]